ncbi:MAG: hypothetical protein J3K34DRAFT_443006 [Monoraphidium minutum]|nr:MAG: hypothetical protein J3K34DRAFT_443006 [Monoraphidium minutum]
MGKPKVLAGAGAATRLQAKGPVRRGRRGGACYSGPRTRGRQLGGPAPRGCERAHDARCARRRASRPQVGRGGAATLGCRAAWAPGLGRAAGRRALMGPQRVNRGRLAVGQPKDRAGRQAFKKGASAQGRGAGAPGACAARACSAERVAAAGGGAAQGGALARLCDVIQSKAGAWGATSRAKAPITWRRRARRRTAGGAAATAARPPPPRAPSAVGAAARAGVAARRR